ncbi:MAG: hypothetical protein IK007_00145 [Lachnospiraceae bacterium]|nr:hypothetical protein [Lachnospiraceae bacterium]
MTLEQEAYQLIQNQSKSNLKIIINLLKALPSKQRKKKRLPVGPGHCYMKLSQEYLDHFDDDNDEITASFYGEA